MRIVDLLRRSAERRRGRLAVRDDTIALTYSELLLHVESLSDFLISNGCGPGVKVALLLDNSALYFLSFFAVSAAESSIMPMLSQMKVLEALTLLRRSDASLAIAEPNLAKKLAGQLGEKDQISIVSIDWDCDGELTMKTFHLAKPREDSENSDVALMVCTSGTTGRLKIVMLTDDQLISNMFVYRSVMDFDEPNTVYCSLRLHHIYAICAQVLTHISLGDAFVATASPFFIKDFLAAVQNHRITTTAFVPYLAMLMAEYPSLNEYDTSSLRDITLSSATTPRHVFQALLRNCGHIKFTNVYGMSEAGSRISTKVFQPGNFSTESVGRPIPGVTVRITNEAGMPLPAGSVGEIQVKSSGVFKGYYNQPQFTEATIVNGWLKTGDLGRLDESGNLYLVGRTKDVINCGGENVYPAEVENCLLENPSISAAAVVGIPDKRLGEIPCAFVVEENGSRIDSTELHRFCRARLSSHKTPRRVHIVEELPKLGNYKVDRQRLHELARNNLSVNL